MVGMSRSYTADRSRGESIRNPVFLENEDVDRRALITAAARSAFGGGVTNARIGTADDVLKDRW
jgi:hypothetical protein